MVDILTFTLPYRLPLLNVRDRTHWAVRRKQKEDLMLEVRSLVGVFRPVAPLLYAAVTIDRYSTQEPDPDSLPSCAKSLLDVLQPMSKRHPLGLGLITEDNSKHLYLRVRHVQSKENRTDVMIESITQEELQRLNASR